MAITDEQWADIEWALADLLDRAVDYKLYRDYYDGDHHAVLSTTEVRNAFERVFNQFRDNLCPRVVDSKADRLQLTGFGSDSDPEAVKAAADAIWQRNMLNRRQGEVHTEAFKMGDSFVLIWPDETGFPIWYPQKAESIAVAWSENNPSVLDRAAKCWWSKSGTERYWRLNLYYADRIEKYRSTNTGQDTSVPKNQNQWLVFQEGTEAWPLAHDLGRVPFFPFNNNAALGNYGKSELKDAVPIQNALNKANLDLMVGSEFAALPQRWATGITVEIDPATGKEVKPWEPGIDKIITSGNPNANFGEFQAANLQQLLNQIEDRRIEMSRVTVTPTHLLLMGSNMPSGVALRVAEGPFVALIQDRQDEFGMPWEDGMQFSLMRLGQDARLAANWTDPVQIDPVEAVNEAKLKKDLGIPDEQIWKELGYSTGQIAEFSAAKADRMAEMQAAMGGLGGTGFAPTPPLPTPPLQ